MTHFSLLGRFEIRLETVPFELSSRPAQALLAHVPLHPDVPLRREKLADVLWPEAPDSNARSSL